MHTAILGMGALVASAVLSFVVMHLVLAHILKDEDDNAA